MSDDEAKKIVKAASAILTDAILGLLQGDPHSWSDRPCSTCLAITNMTGKPFGCYHYQAVKKARQEIRG